MGLSKSQEGQSAPPHPAAPNFSSASRAVQAGSVNPEGPASKRQRTVAGLPVCSLLPPVDEVPVSYVATHVSDERPVYDHKTGERPAPHLVKVGRRTECEAMISHQLFERVPIWLARGKKVRCQWLDEMKEGADGTFVRSRLVAMEVARGIRFDACAGTVSRGLRRSRTREDDTAVCSPCTTSALCSATRSYLTMSQSRCTRHVVKRKLDTCGKRSEPCMGHDQHCVSSKST